MINSKTLCECGCLHSEHSVDGHCPLYEFIGNYRPFSKFRLKQTPLEAHKELCGKLGEDLMAVLEGTGEFPPKEDGYCKDCGQLACVCRWKVGMKITFLEEPKGPYTVMAVSKKFVILTKPYNPQRTVIYTICDLAKNLRNRNNYVFSPFNYAVQADIDKCLAELDSGKCEISHRGAIPIHITSVTSKL